MIQVEAEMGKNIFKKQKQLGKKENGPTYM